MALRSELNELGNALKTLATENDKSINSIRNDLFDRLQLLRELHARWSYPKRSKIDKEYKEDFQKASGDIKQIDAAIIAKIQKLYKLEEEIDARDKESERKLSEYSQKKIEALKSKSAESQSVLRNQLGKVLPDLDYKRKLTAIHKEFNIKLDALNKETEAQVEALDQTNKVQIAAVYDKLDGSFLRLINQTAQKVLLASLHELELSLMVKLSSLTFYDLNQAQKLANVIIEDIASQLSKNENISFANLARKADSALRKDLQGHYFGFLTTSIREEYAIFSEPTAFFYNALYDAKKNELEQIECFKKYHTWRKNIEANILQYMLERINPHEFHMKFVYIGMQQKQYKDGLMSSVEFQTYEKETYKTLFDEITRTYEQFFADQRISDDDKNALDEEKIRNKFFRSVTSEYMKFNDMKPFTGDVTSKDILETISAQSQEGSAAAPSKNVVFKSRYMPQLFKTPEASVSFDEQQVRCRVMPRK